MLRTFKFHSKTLEVNHESIIYIPDSFVGISPNLPVHYLLRGKPEEWFDYPPERNARNVITVVEHLIQLKYLEPLALVFPGMTDPACSYFACGFDLFDPPRPMVEGIGTGVFQAFFFQEYMPLIESEFHLGESSSKRSIGGFSLGSLAAFSLAFSFPDLFCALSSYDGAFLFWNNDHPSGCGNPSNDLRLDIFPYWFGDPPDLEYFRRYNPADILFSACGEKLLSISRLKIYQHSANEYHPTANNWREMRLRNMLADCNIPNQFSEIILHEHARHDWYWLDEHLYRLLPPLSRNFR